MAIRIAEYAFIVARQFASWDIGHATIPMPRFSIIYVKKTDQTPKTTTITFSFPDGQTIDYKSDNVILEEFTKEKIVEKVCTLIFRFTNPRHIITDHSRRDLCSGRAVRPTITQDP